MSFQQYSFQETEPSKHTGKNFKVYNEKSKNIKTIVDKNNNALARARWGSDWFETDKPARLLAQAKYRAQQEKEYDEDAVFGAPAGETKEEGETNEQGETKEEERNVYRVIMTAADEDSEDLLYYGTKLDSSNLLKKTVKLKANPTKKNGWEKWDDMGQPEYWAPRLWKTGEYVEITSGWSERDGNHVLPGGANFQGLIDPNKVIEQLFKSFRTGFGPYEEDDGWNGAQSFHIYNDIFMIEVGMFNQLSVKSRKILCGPINKNSLVFPNIWIYSDY